MSSKGDLAKHTYLRDVGLPAMLVAVVLLASALLMLGANVSVLNKNFARVERTNAALLTIANVDEKVIEVEMSMRGFALTNDPAYLHAEERNQAELLSSMNGLAALVAGEPSLAENLRKLRAPIARHIARFSHLAKLGPNHMAEVAAAAEDPKKLQDRIEARTILNAMRDGELKELATRQESTERKAAQTYDLAVGIVIIAFVVGALGFALTLYGRRKEAEINARRSPDADLAPP